MKNYIFILLIITNCIGISELNAKEKTILISNDSIQTLLNNWKEKDSLTQWIIVQKKYSQQFRNNREYSNSLNVLDSALSTIWRSARNREEHYQLAWLYVNRAYLFEIEGNFINAQRDYLIAINIFTQIEEDSYNLARFAWHPLGNIYTRLGENELAIQFIQKSISKYKELNAIPDLVSAYSDLGIAFINQAKYKQALEILNEGIHVKFEDPLNRALLYANKANALLQLTRYKEGLSTVDSTLELYQIAKTAYKENTYSERLIQEYLIRTLTLKAKLYTALDLYDNADATFNTAVESFGLFENKKHRLIAKVYLGLAKLKQKQHLSKDALLAYQDALKAIIPSFNNSNLAVNPTANELYADVTIGETILGKANAAKEYFKITNDINWLLLSKNCYQLYFAWEKKIRSEYFFESSKLQFTEELHQATESALGLLKLIQDQKAGINCAKQAFHWIEQSKGVLLSESSTNIDHQFPTLNDDSVFQQLQLHKKQYRLLLKNHSDLVKMDKTQHAHKLQESIFILESQLKNKFPHYNKVKTAANDTLNISFLKQYLEQQQADLISYYIGTRKAFVVFINQHKFYFLSINHSEIKKLSDQFFPILNNPDENSDRYNKVAFKLYKRLIPFDSLATNKNWIILPDGELNKIPFEALVCQMQKKPAKFKTLNYVVYKKQIAYSPSAKFLLRSPNKTSFQNTYLGISPDFKNSSLAPLQHALTEVEIGKTQFGGELLTGSMIDKEALFNQISSYKIIHWVSHAGVDSAHRDGAWIALNAGKNDRSRIFPPELLPLQLSTHLLNLNACETAIGKYKAGEGIYSLSRGFAFAGVQNILTNLWQANHEASSQLMSNFYSNLKQDGNISVALSTAKRNYIESELTDELGAHPYYWAAPILIGNNHALEIKNEFEYPFILISLFILALILMLFKKYKKLQ